MAENDLSGADNPSVLEGWSRRADLAAADKEMRIAQLQKMTSMSFNNFGAQQAHSNLEDGNRKKVELTRQVDGNRKMLEDMALNLKQLQVAIEAVDQKATGIDKRQTELREKMELLHKNLDASCSNKCEAIIARVKAEEENRLLLGQEFQMALGQREKIINQTIQTEVRTESAARQTLLTDISRLSEALKDLRLASQDANSNVSASISALQAKVSGQFAEVNDSLNAERVVRERSLSAVRNDNVQRCGELKSLVESKFHEVSKEAKEAIGQLTFQAANLREDLTMSNSVREKQFDAAEKLTAKNLAEVIAEVNMRIDLSNNDVSIKNKNQTDSVTDVRDLVRQEATARERAFNNLQEMLAQEHYRREQDEATIINLMEAFMRQMRESTKFSS